jgi:ABC-type nitrate/sulfonate/bicarbonate transport system substrate-binding protein
MLAALRIVALAALVFGAASPGFAADKIRVGKASPTSDVMLPVDIGVKTGIFQKHGLAVEINTFTGGAKLHQAMAAEALDIGVGAGTEFALLAKGAPELAVADVAGPVLFIGIGVLADSPVHTADDLKGRKIGVSSNGSLTYWLAQELARVKGWGPGGVTPVAIGNSAGSYVAAMKTKQIDAFISTTSVSFQLEEKGEGRLVLPVSQYTGNMAAGTIFATNDFIAKNPEAVKRFLAGWFDTIDWMSHHKAETVKMTSELTHFSENVQAKEYDLTMSMFSKTGKFDAQSLATLKRSFMDLKILATPPDLTKYYTEKFLPQS